MSEAPLLEVEDLHVTFRTPKGPVEAVLEPRQNISQIVNLIVREADPASAAARDRIQQLYQSTPKDPKERLRQKW